MNYEENNFSSNRKKFSTGLILIIVCILLIIAFVAWFALSRSDTNMPDSVSEVESDMGSMYSEIESDVNSVVSEISSDINSSVSEIKSEYDDMTSSYNNSTSDTTSVEDNSVSSNAAPTGEGVSSVPYNSTAFAKPVEGEILKDFSTTELQYSKTFGDMRLHSGIDIACEKGTAVSACADGKILTVEESNQYGNIVTIDHKNGITAKYCSLEGIKVKEGESVKAGDIIGTVGTVPAECNDKDHLHFEVYKDGIAVSPLKTLGLE